MRLKIVFDISQPLLTYVGRVADDYIKSTCLHDFGKLRLPIECVDAVHLLRIEHIYLLALLRVEIRANQGVAALDILLQVRQGSLLEEPQLLYQAALVLPLQHLEQEGEKEGSLV